MKKILIVAGEPSGDLHASNLVKDIRSIYPDIEFFGLGGELSRNAGVDVILDIAKLALVGLAEVLKNASIVKDAFLKVLSRIDAERPDLAILVDYPGFNLRLAKALRKLEPMMRRAGLGDASIMLGGGIAAVGLFEPPATAALVFAHAHFLASNQLHAGIDEGMDSMWRIFSAMLGSFPEDKAVDIWELGPKDI